MDLDGDSAWLMDGQWGPLGLLEAGGGWWKQEAGPEKPGPLPGHWTDLRLGGV